MFRAFDMRYHEAEIEALPSSSLRSTSGSGTQADSVANDMLLDSLTTLLKATGVDAMQHYAHLAVMGELLASMLMHLPAAMQADIAGTFRGRIEDPMSLSDGIRFAEQYHSAFLTEAHRYLNTLF